MQKFNPQKSLIILLSGLLLISSCKKNEELISEPTIDVDTSPRHIIKEYFQQKLIKEYFYSDNRIYKVHIYSSSNITDTLIFEYDNNKIIHSKQRWTPYQNDWHINEFYYDVYGLLARFEFNGKLSYCEITYDDNFEMSNMLVKLDPTDPTKYSTIEGGNVVSTFFSFGGNNGVGNTLTFDNHENPLYRFWVAEPTPFSVSMNNVLSERYILSKYIQNGTGVGDHYEYDTAYFAYSYEYNQNYLPIKKFKTTVATQKTVTYSYEYIDL